MLTKITAKTIDELELFFKKSLSPKEMSSSLLNVSFEGEKKFISYILNAIVNKTKIAIIGDYDVDGVTASAILFKVLSFFGINSLVILPNRFVDGYGLNKRLIDIAKAKGSEIIITVDNGIREKESIEYAKAQGMKVIITDHHTPSADCLPNADLIINPHLTKSNLQTKEICGATTVTFLCLALLKFISSLPSLKSKEKSIYNLREEIIELAAIATICDVMPLEYENRKLVKYLLNLMHRNEDQNEGISLLMKEMGLGNAEFNVESVSFGLGPALNSAGRLDTATSSLKVLMKPTSDNIEKLIALNNERKKLTSELVKLSFEQISLGDETNVIYLENANEGIIGIIAGKVAESTLKPTYIFTNTHEGFVKGSARGPEWCNLFTLTDTVLRSKDYAVKYGGHAGALGLSLKSKDVLDDFKSSQADIVKTMDKTVKDKTYFEYPEAFTLSEIKNVLDKFEPFGEGFEEPVFVIRRKPRMSKKIGENHVSFKIFLDKKTMIDCYYFFAPHEIDESKTQNIYFKIKKSISDKTGKKKYEAYVTKLED